MHAEIHVEQISGNALKSSFFYFYVLQNHKNKAGNGGDVGSVYLDACCK